MRQLLIVCVAAGLASAPLRGQEKAQPGLTPIAIAKLDRKTPISYEKDVAPIFMNKCTVCHAGNLIEGKFDMGTYAAIMKGGKKGVAVVPGKVEESPLWMRSSHRMKPIMPPKSEDNPLTPEEVAVLKLWIEEGAKGPEVDVRARRTVVVGLPPILVKPVRAVAVSPDKKFVVASRGNQLHVFETAKGEYVKTLVDPELKTPEGKPASAAHLSLVESMAFSPDGKTLATGTFGQVNLWDFEKGTIKQRISGFVDRVVAIHFSPDGKLFATGGGAPTEDGEIRVYETATGKLIREILNGHSDTVFGVSFSPDNKLLATGSADKFVKVFDVGSGKYVKSFEGHTHHVMDVCWTKDGKKLVSASADSMIKTWDYEKGEKVRDIKGHNLPVNRLAFISTTGKVLSVSGDKTMRQWNPESGGQERSFSGAKDFLYAVGTSPDGAIVACGGEEGVIQLYNGANGQLIKAMLPPGAEPEKKNEPQKKK